MNEGGLVLDQIGPEESIFELKLHGAGGISVHFRDEEQPGRDLAVDAARRQLPFLPHDHAQGIDPPRRLFQHVLHNRGIRRLRLTDRDRRHHAGPLIGHDKRRRPSRAHAVEREDHETHPHEPEAAQLRARERFLEREDPEQELDGRRDVLQDADDGQRALAERPSQTTAAGRR